MGVLLEYPADEPDRRRVELGVGRKKAAKKTLGVGVIGVGDFARGVILPRLKKIDGVELRGVCSRSGLTARHIGERLGFAFCTADSGEVIEDEGTDLVLVMTRHGEHAGLVEAALKRDKDVFVEKPLALSEAQLGRVYRAQRDGQGRVMVGFNRRYAPATVAAQRFFGEGGPLALTYRINAGPLPPDHWIYDPEEGGGRILGEVCHFIDLCGHLVGASPVMVHAQAMGQGRGDDNVALVLSYEDGSVGQILYTASGSDQMPKERLEVFGAGVVAVIDDFADLTVFDKTKTRRPLKGAQDKGHRAELEALVRGGLGGAWPMDFASAGATTLAALRAVESLGEGAPRPLGWENFVAAEGKDR